MIDLDFKFYRAILWKRLPLILLVWMLIAGIAIAVAYLLPPVYRSSARILVEKPQIDPSLAQNTVTVTSGEIIQNIQQRLMTRANMLDIAERFNVFAQHPDYSPSERVEAMRSATNFRVTNLGDVRSRLPSTTVFSVSFSSDNPEMASLVANELVTFIQEQNIKIRTGSAENTAAFFKQESTRLANDLTDLESQIVDFENQNADALPDSLEFRRGEMSRLQARLIQIDTQRQGLLEQKAQLERFLSDPSLMPQAPIAQQTPEERQLIALNTQLAQLKAIYSDTHPQVIQVKAQIEVLEAAIRGTTANAQDPNASGGVPSQMQLNLDQINTNLAFLDTQTSDLEKEIERIKSTIEQTPNVAMALNVLNRKYTSLQSQYNSAVNQLNTASTGESIELRQQGERFEVIEQATVPEQPESPPRLLIAAAGLLGGLGMGLGLVVLLELLNKSVRRPSELVNALGIQPFATVPYIATQGEIMRRRLKTAAGLLAVAVGVPALLYFIHYQYLPIDLIISRVMERFGLDDITRSLG